ncbi:MAG: hypothetical protein ACRC62_11865 [Microcoleus sp.]
MSIYLSTINSQRSIDRERGRSHYNSQLSINRSRAGTLVLQLSTIQDRLSTAARSRSIPS